MMKDLYYLTAVLLIIYECKWLANPVRESMRHAEADIRRAELRALTWKDMTPHEKYLASASLLPVIKFFWTLAGAFYSFQPLIFMVYIAVTFVFGKTQRNIVFNPKLGAIISIAGIIFIVLNAYYFKYQIYLTLNFK